MPFGSLATIGMAMMGTKIMNTTGCIRFCASLMLLHTEPRPSSRAA